MFCVFTNINLIVTDHNTFISDNVLKTVLSLYMEDKAMPLPSLEEVLICTQQTTEEEVLLRVDLQHSVVIYIFIQDYSVVEKSYW